MQRCYYEKYTHCAKLVLQIPNIYCSYVKCNAAQELKLFAFTNIYLELLNDFDTLSPALFQYIVVDSEGIDHVFSPHSKTDVYSSCVKSICEEHLEDRQNIHLALA